MLRLWQNGTYGEKLSDSRNERIKGDEGEVASIQRLRRSSGTRECPTPKLVMYEVKDSSLQQVLCLDTLLDTSSLISFIKERFIGKQGLHPLDSSDRDYCGSKMVQLELLGKVYAKISIGDIMRENLRVHVVPKNSLLTPALLGRDILHKFSIRLTLPTPHLTHL